MDERLQRVLDAHRLPCGAVIAASGEVVARAGDFGAFDSAGLVSAMLGPYGSAEATYHLVQDSEQVKPVIWGQGSEFAFLDCAGCTSIINHSAGFRYGDALARMLVVTQYGFIGGAITTYRGNCADGI